MAERNTVNLTFAGDARQLDRTFDQVGRGAQEMSRDIEDASEQARRFSRSADDMAEAADGSESRLIGVNDVISGFADVVGIALPPQFEMIQGFADMAGGLAALLPDMSKMNTVMKAVNATMRANPILTVVTVLALLTAALVVAYKKSETFRNIVNGTFDAVKDAARAMGRVFKGVAEVLFTPYRIAFNLIADAWNNTVGRLSFKVPGWVPGLGGKGFDVPDIPKFANGGRFDGGPMIVGERGPELLVPGFAGAVVPNNQLGGGQQTVVLRIEGDGDLVNMIRKSVRVRGGNVQAVLG